MDGGHAIPASDAFLEIDRDDAVSVRRCANRAHVGAGRIFAVVAENRHIDDPGIWIGADFVFKHLGPQDARAGAVLVLASQGAGIAPYAALLV
jgi:hypothetical protein